MTCKAAELPAMTSAAFLSDAAALCSPSAAITLNCVTSFVDGSN